MKKVEFVLLVIHGAGNKIEGRTILQKMAYFAAFFAKFDLDYQPHYYGPFSYKLEHAVSLLADAGYLVETMQVLPALGSNAFDACKYTYKLTAGGKKAAQQLTDKFTTQWVAISESIKSLKGAFKNNVTYYSLAAKIYYLLSFEEKPLEIDEIQELAEDLNWQIDTKDIKKVANKMVSLGLVG